MYLPEHECKKLILIQTSWEEEEEDVEMEIEGEGPSTNEAPKISLHALAGLNAPKIMSRFR